MGRASRPGEIYKEARKLGIADRTLKRAAGEAGSRAREGRFGRGWEWWLHEGAKPEADERRKPAFLHERARRGHTIRVRPLRWSPKGLKDFARSRRRGPTLNTHARASTSSCRHRKTTSRSDGRAADPRSRRSRQGRAGTSAVGAHALRSGRLAGDQRRFLRALRAGRSAAYQARSLAVDSRRRARALVRGGTRSACSRIGRDWGAAGARSHGCAAAGPTTGRSNPRPS